MAGAPPLLSAPVQSPLTVFYFVFGPAVANHQQAAFSALTLLAQAAGDVRVVVLTDHPDYYGLFGDRITVEPLAAEQIDAWQGPHRFFWRVKVKALEFVRARYPGHVLYLDGDTFFYGDVRGLRATLDAGTHLMHLSEGALSTIRNASERRAYAAVGGRAFAGVQILPTDIMYNAGVVGVSAAASPCPIPLALQMCDEMCEAGAEHRFLEQFSLSVALARTGGVVVCPEVVGHYWGNKAEWSAWVGAFFTLGALRGYRLGDYVEAAREADLHALPVRVRMRHTNRRVKQLIDRYVPLIKERLYLTP